MSDGKFKHNVVACAVGEYRARKTGFGLLGSNLCVCNDCTHWISDGAPNAPRDLLSRQTEASKHDKYQNIANDVHVAFESPSRFGSRHTSLCTPKGIRITGSLFASCPKQNVAIIGR